MERSMAEEYTKIGTEIDMMGSSSTMSGMARVFSTSGRESTTEVFRKESSMGRENSITQLATAMRGTSNKIRSTGRAYSTYYRQRRNTKESLAMTRSVGLGNTVTQMEMCMWATSS